MKKARLPIWIMVLLLPGTWLNAQVPDSVRIYNWVLDGSYLRKERVPVDTLIDRFQVIHPAFESPSFYATLGNIGAPLQDMDFFNRPATGDFPFLDPYLPYLHRGANTRFFNTKRPFTHLAYTTAGSKVNQEQTLHVLHTQNINPGFNAGLQYDLISSAGQYSWQDAHVPTFRLFSSMEKERYTFHLSANTNKLEVQENGGIVDDGDLGAFKPKDIPINLPNNLNNAVSLLRHRDLTFVQTYTVGKTNQPGPVTDSLPAKKHGLNLSGTFSHLLQYQSSSRTYTDEEPRSGFYDTTYIDPSRTYDSAYYRNLANTLQFEFRTDTTRKVSFLIRGGLSYEFQRFVNRIPTDTIIGAGNDTTYRDLRTHDYQLIRASYYLKNALTQALQWDAGGYLYLTGYRQGDLLLKGNLRLRFGKGERPLFLLLSASLENRKPTYFLDGYQSNNYQWTRSFNNITDTRISGKMYTAGEDFSLSGSYALIDNRVYFDTTGTPRQEIAPVSVLAGDLQKTFRLGLFRSVNRALVQLTSNDAVLPLPLFSFYQSTYFDYRIFFRFTNGTLYYQLGYDLSYQTAYYGPGYVPATGMFYNQREKKIGNYPYLDVFLNLKVKRTRFFLKFEHVHSGLLPARYFTVLHYPMNDRMFKFGLAWTFYD